MKEQHLAKPNIYIIGAGISGLIAAMVLEEKGHYPIILEKSDRVGGRLKTDIVKGYQLDRGFQVLLSAYPAAQKYLDYEQLQLQELKSGACIFKNNKAQLFGDPLRDASLLFPSILSGIAKPSDLLKIAKLTFRLKNKSLSSIFQEKEESTLEMLQKLGFSNQLIKEFFKPFFSGIFLENELITSSRMFHFVFKMFAEGNAFIPKTGIEAIPLQLKEKLQQTNFRFHTAVKTVNKKGIHLENGEVLNSDYTLIATDNKKLIEPTKDEQLRWKSCQTLYFTSPKRMIEQSFIGLISQPGGIINNLFYHSSIEMAERKEKELLSVTVVQKHQLSQRALIQKVKEELQLLCGIESLEFLHMYDIKKALPHLHQLQYSPSKENSKPKEGIYVAGDHTANSSLNAAILSGEQAAFSLLEDLGRHSY